MNLVRQELLQYMTEAVENEAGIWSVSFMLPPAFIGFQGHFPQRPILPAVVQLLAGVLTAQKISGKTLEIASVSNAKFLQPVSPEVKVTVSCTPKSSHCDDVAVRLITSEGVASSFSLQLKEAGVL